MRYPKLPSCMEFGLGLPSIICLYLRFCSSLMVGKPAMVCVKKEDGMLFLHSAMDPAGSSHVLSQGGS